MPLPDWLPKWFNFANDFRSKLQDLIEAAYKVFKKDFLTDPLPQHKGKIVICNNSIGKEGKESGFWHLIEHDFRKIGVRTVDIRSAEKLPWLKPIIENYNKPEVICWEIKENGEIKTYIWLKKFEYVAVLSNQKNSYFLKTASHINYNHYRRLLEKKYDRRIK